MKSRHVISQMVSGPSLAGAACAGKAPLFDARAEGESQALYLRRYRKAAGICRTCPVLDACDQAVNDSAPGQRSGIWAERRYGRGA